MRCKYPARLLSALTQSHAADAPGCNHIARESGFILSDAKSFHPLGKSYIHTHTANNTSLPRSFWRTRDEEWNKLKSAVKVCNGKVETFYVLTEYMADMNCYCVCIMKYHVGHVGELS